MQIKRTFKYRLYPTNIQRDSIDDQLELCRKLYNHLLGTKKETFLHGNESLSKFDLNDCISYFNENNPDFMLIHSQVKQNISIIGNAVDMATRFNLVHPNGSQMLTDMQPNLNHSVMIDAVGSHYLDIIPLTQGDITAMVEIYSPEDMDIDTNIVVKENLLEMTERVIADLVVLIKSEATAYIEDDGYIEEYSDEYFVLRLCESGCQSSYISCLDETIVSNSTLDDSEILNLCNQQYIDCTDGCYGNEEMY